MDTIDFTPVSGLDMPRYAGVPTFMRLPHIALNDPNIAKVDIGLVGAPWDSGTTNRPGARHGPRQLRDLSTMIRAAHGVTGVRPFERLHCADIGDVPPNPVDIADALQRMTTFFDQLKQHSIRPLTAGGDHLCSLPILRSLASDAPLGLIQFDSHTDLFDSYFEGNRYTHGTPFRRAVEEELIDPKRMIQIGIRGTAYSREDRDFAQAVGIRIITIEDFFNRGVDDVMSEARSVVGTAPTYITYDIDFIDPTFAPGTGTPEVGGPNSFQALQVVRALADVNIAGADVVEVSPPFDPNGMTAWLAVSIMFELLCVMV